MKRLILTIIALILIITGSAMLVHGQEITIDITTETESISVIENITADSESIDFISIAAYPLDRIVVINGNTVALPEMYNLPYSINLTEQNIAIADYYEVKYSLDKDAGFFKKMFLEYNTTLISITFDGTEIFTGSDLKTGSSFTVELQKPTQIQTEIIPTWIYIVIIILIVLLIVVLAMKTKKQKSTTKKENIGASEELLDTKKSLLMETLKDIEKRHRAKEISDDTYHKLREQYKQQAVETMKKLEDMNSKIK